MSMDIAALPPQLSRTNHPQADKLMGFLDDVAAQATAHVKDPNFPETLAALRGRVDKIKGSADRIIEKNNNGQHQDIVASFKMVQEEADFTFEYLKVAESVYKDTIVQKKDGKEEKAARVDSSDKKSRSVFSKVRRGVTKRASGLVSGVVNAASSVFGSAKPLQAPQQLPPAVDQPENAEDDWTLI